MGLFSGLKKNKKDGGNGNGNDRGIAAAGSSPVPAKQSRHKYHSRRKKSNLIQDMKINGSVPTTIIDAIHGDKSIISSDQDFVRAPKINLSGKIYYPVFIMDEDTFEKSGIADPQNRKTYGQLSNGLKTSSGATGLLPIVTDDSSKNNYFAILPMHDAFVFLDEKSVFADYQPGWLVGLLNIDHDELNLQKTDIRLTMAQWMDFINNKLNFKVDQGHLSIDQDLPETSDPLAFSGAEDGTDATSAAVKQNSDPLDEFDEDDTANGDSSHDNGYGIDDLPVAGNDRQSSSNNNAVDQVSNNQPPVQPQSQSTPQPAPQPPVNQNPQPSPQQLPVQQQQRPVQQAGSGQVQPTPQINPNQNQNNNAVNTTQSREELASDNVTLSSTVRTLNDLQISISDQEFVDAYMRPLRINPIPLEDESNDPTGRIHHVNELRRQANLELQSSENNIKARLRQWFETQRAGELDALNEGVRDGGSLIQKQRKILKKLQDNLNDEDGLRSISTKDIQNRLDELDQRFEQARQNARQAALVEVDAQFNQKQVELDQQKNELIQQQMAQSRQDLARKITGVKDKIQEIAQTAASKGYMQIMEQGAGEYRDSQQALDHLHKSLIENISRYEKRMRDEENKRVANQAAIAKNDATIQTLREQMSEANSRHQDDLAKQGREYQRSLEQFKQEAAADKTNTLAKLKEDLEDAKTQRDQATDRLSKQQKTYEDLLTKHDQDNLTKLNALRDDMKDSDLKNDQVIKRMKVSAWMMVGLSILLGLVVGYFAGTSSAYKDQNQRNSSVTTPVYQYTPAYNNQSSTTSSSSSSSSQASSSASSSDDDSTVISSKEHTDDRHADLNSDSSSHHANKVTDKKR